MTPAFVGGFLQVKMKHVKILIIILAVSNQTLYQSAIGQQTNRPAPKLMPLVVTMSGWSDAQTEHCFDRLIECLCFLADSTYKWFT